MTPEEARDALGIIITTNFYEDASITEFVDAVLFDVPLLMRAIGAKQETTPNPHVGPFYRWVTTWKEATDG